MKKNHVIVVTYPAQGHINPLLQFAKRLAAKGLKVTFATTPYTVDFIRPTADVTIELISDGFDDGGFIKASSLESYLESFKSAGSETLAKLISNLNDSVSDFPVSCIVYDALLTWALDVAKRLGIYAAAFSTTSASIGSIFWRIDRCFLSLPVKREDTPLLIPGLPLLDFCDLPSFVVEDGPKSAYLGLVLEQIAHLDENDWVFCNTFEDLEDELAKAMSGLWNMSMIGPMLPSSYLDQQIDGDTDYGANLLKSDSDQYLKWLDTKPPKSVIYASFGSMADIEGNQFEEIAWGLKATGYNFLWVVKGSGKKLPIEFVNSIGETGLLVSWCNQLEVLAHRAVGCFVTHCGWNSTLEGLSLGVPMIGIPQRVDQPMNAKFLEVWGVGLRAKEDEGGIVTRQELNSCIREVMVVEKNEEIKKNAYKFRDLAKRSLSVGGKSDEHINEFVEKLVKGEAKKA